MRRRKRIPTSLLSDIGDVFEEAPFLLSRDLMEDMSSAPPQQKVVYTNLDERSSVEAMPIYIREGNIRYTTTTPPLDEASVNNYYGGGGGGSHPCPDYIFDAADDDVPASGTFLIVKSIVENAHEVIFRFGSMHFQEGCLFLIDSDVNHSTHFTKKHFTACGGTTTAVYDVRSDQFQP